MLCPRPSRLLASPPAKFAFLRCAFAEALSSCALLALVFLFQIGFAAESDPDTGQLLQMPMHFEANYGQVAEPVQFVSRGPGYTLFLTPSEAVLSLRSKKSSAGRASKSGRDNERNEVRLAMTLVGGNQNPRGEGVDALPGVANYLLGPDPAGWRTGIPTFGKVKYHEVYAGIDLMYYGNQQQLEYDFIVHPFADPGQIILRLNGARRVQIAKDGQLMIDIPGGVVRWRKPIGYQQSAGGRIEVPTRFVLKGRREVAFEVGHYDRSKPLIIDPIVVYSTYLGGSAGDFALGIALHTGGSVYVVGDTTSLNFPTRSAFRTSSAGSNDLFVARLTPSGGGLVYSTYIGGAGDDYASGITVDPAGSAFITGYTDSQNFPTRNPAYGANAGFFDIFVTKLGVNGSNLVYSTYLGGAGDDFGRAIAIDNSGNAYVTGRTYSKGTGNGPFPTTQGAYQRNNGNGNTIGADAFVTKFTTNGTVSYSTFLGGRSEERATGIAVDNSGNAYVVGEVSSFPIYPDPPSSDFPTVNAFQSQFNQGSTDPLGGTSDGFLTRFNAAGTALTFSTFLGGFDNDLITGIALDSSGRICLAGVTSSTNFPSFNGAQPQNAGMSIDPFFPGPDAFVTQFQSNGTALRYSTYLGGTLDEFPFLLDRFGIAVDRFGNLYIAGQTGSFDFPVTQGADQTNSAGSIDGFVAKINPAATGPASLVYASFLSGSKGLQPGAPDNEAGPIAVDTSGNFYVAGITSATNFPVTPGAYRTTSAGGFNDVFVAKFSSPPDLSVSMAAAPNPSIVGSNVTYTIRVHNNGMLPFTGVTNIVQFPTNVQFGAINPGAGSFRTLNGVVTFTIGALVTNGVVTQTIVIMNNSPGTFTNIASVSSLETASLEPNKSNNVAAVVAPVRGIADLTLVQSAAPSPTFVTSNLTYTIGVTNKGPSPATFVTLTNPLPASLAFISAVPTVGICTTNTNGIVCQFGTLASGAGVGVTINTIAQISGTITNAPVTSAFEADFSPANNTSALPTTITPLTELGLSVTGSTNAVFAGNSIVFTLRVTNRGPSAATGVILTNPFPAGATFVSATASSGTTNLSSSGIRFNFGTVASNAVATATLTLRAPANSSTILNTASITNSAGADPVPGNNSASANATVMPNADLALTQSANPTALGVSSNTTFTITLTNRGPSPASNVVLTDSVPPSFSVLSAQSTFGPCQVQNNVVTCNIGNLAAGAAGTVTIVARANAYGAFTSAAQVGSGVADLVSNNNQAGATVTISDLPDQPSLTIQRVGTNAILSWSTNATARGFGLQSRTGFSPGTPWTPVPNTPVTIGRDSVVTNGILSGTSRLYRLARIPQPLSVMRVGNSIVISWPAVGSATLRRGTDLPGSGTWTSAGTPTLIGNRYYVTNAISGTRTFYRLFN